MSLLIGTDEAGYGPNLGPLVVGATLWELNELSRDLYQEFNQWIHADSDGQPVITIADSKSVYQSGASIAALESSVLTMLSVAGRTPADFFDLARRICGLSKGDLQSQITYDWNHLDLPVEADRSAFSDHVDRIRNGLRSKLIKCSEIRCATVFPDQFNCQLKDCGSKATLLTEHTCTLVRQLLNETNGRRHLDDVLVLCDKHGGRTHYAGLLQHIMTDQFITVLYESRETSAYRWTENDRTIEIRFVVKGERLMPVALASMTAKYVRELAMRAWNSFWKLQLPEIRPTAGYPVDARRFKREIAERQSALGIADESIWRRK